MKSMGQLVSLTHFMTYTIYILTATKSQQSEDVDGFGVLFWNGSKILLDACSIYSISLFTMIRVRLQQQQRRRTLPRKIEQRRQGAAVRLFGVNRQP